MAKVSELLRILDSIAPFSLAMDFDNPGLIVGDRDSEIEGILFTVDATEQVIREAVQAGTNVIISHHPLLFSPAKHIVEHEGEGALLRALIKQDINLIAMHTNYDVGQSGVNRALAERIGLRNPVPLEGDGQREVLIRAKLEERADFSHPYRECWQEGEWRCGVFAPYHAAAVCHGLKEEGILHHAQSLLSEGEWGYGLMGEIGQTTLTAFSGWIKERLSATCVKYTGDGERTISKLAVACGSGKSVFERALVRGAQAVLTGECTYDAALLYTRRGLSIIEAGHYDTEKWFMESLYSRLQNALIPLQWNVRMRISRSSKDVYSGAI